MVNRWFLPGRIFDPDHPEMVDMPDPDPVLLRGEMKNLRKINRRFGGISPVVREVRRLTLATDPNRPLTILDLATGSADVPLALVDALTRDGRGVQITAIDRNDLVLEEAKRHVRGTGVISFVKGDILNMEYPDDSFDIVLCSLALHHFMMADVIRIIREMDRLGRVGFIICDLRRSITALACAWAYTRLTTRNIMTRTDAIASVLASFTITELRELLFDAGMREVDVSRVPIFRLVATKKQI